MKDLLMPVLALICGLVSLHVDPKDRRKRWLLVSGLLATTAFTIWFNIAEGRSRAGALQASQQREHETRQILLNLTEQTRPIPDLVELLRGFGFTEARAQGATVERVATSLAADRAFRGLAVGREARARRAVRVEYFPKDVDGARVIQALEQAGFQVVRKTSVRPEATNAIWAGNDVSLDDVKVVALALLRAGVDVVAVRRFNDGAGAKANLMQVGTDARLIGEPTLTPEDVSALSSISRDDR